MNAAPTSFVIGNVYSLVLFADTDLRIPVIKTIRFTSSHQQADGANVLVFQRIGLEEDATERVAFGERAANEVVVDGTGLIERLALCFEGVLASPRPDR